MVAASWLRRVTPFAVTLSLIWVTGCVGPMACGPTGSCGPVGLHSCDGCGECEGCGELYLDPWINHPADVCDPCDQCGNYNGQSCGKCRSVLSGIASLWGYRCGDCAPPRCGCGDVSCGGCDGAVGPGCGIESCGGCDACCAEPVCGIEPACGIESCDGCDACCATGSSGYLSGVPTPADVVEIKPAEEPYKPSRTRKIFRSRESIAEGPPKATDY